MVVEGTSIRVRRIAKIMCNVNKTAIEVNITLSEDYVHVQCEHNLGKDH